MVLKAGRQRASGRGWHTSHAVTLRTNFDGEAEVGTGTATGLAEMRASHWQQLVILASSGVVHRSTPKTLSFQWM